MNAKACLKSGRVFWALLAGLTAATVPKVRGGSVSTDFNSGSAPGYLLGGAYLDSVGGVDGSGCLKLTTSFYNGQMGSFILDDLDGGAPITGFRASFRMLIGGGSGADGLSFNFANDYTWSEFGEEGDGTGLTISFDTYDNGGGEAPAIDVKKGGNIIFSRKGNLELFRTGDYVDVVVQVDPEGTLDLTVNNTLVVSHLVRAFTQMAGQFAFGARTGGLTDNHFIDNLEITTTTELPSTPFVREVSPTGAGVALDSIIQVVIQDGQTEVDPGSIELRVNGSLVATVVERVGNLTTVSYDPPGLLAYGTTYPVQVSFSNLAAPTVRKSVSFSFTSRYLRGPNGNFYELVYNQEEWLTWPQAKVAAESRNWGGSPGHLATITSRDEDVFVELVRSTTLPRSDVIQEAWVGGFQPLGSPTRENWTWVNGESGFPGVNGTSVYANWLVNEPNDYFGDDSENYLTVGLNGQFGWNDSGSFGAATLRGSVVEYEALPMPVDFKPGDSANRVQASSKGKVILAILTTPAFNARSVVVETITAGRSGIEARPLSANLADVNGDGVLDLQLQFDMQDLGLRCGDAAVVVFAENTAGAPLRGSDRLELLNCPPYGLSITALKDAANQTDVYLNINALIGGFVVPPSADQVLLKSYDAAGHLAWTRTANSVVLSPTDGNSRQGVLHYSDLDQFQPVSGQMQVKNSKNGSAEIMRAEGRVLLRPDLEVPSVQAPTQVKVRQVLNVKAVVTEANRDVGATCKAYLMDGGTIVDTAEGLRIEAGGSATVLFAARFFAPGRHQLRVVAGDVVPGDYNLGNNGSSEFTVDVTEANLQAAQYELSYRSQKYQVYSEERNAWGIFVYKEKQNFENVDQYLYVPSLIHFPIDRFSASVYADGVEKTFAEFLDVQPAYSEEYGCFRETYAAVQVPNATMSILMREDRCNGSGETFITFGRGSGEILFFSAEYTLTWEPVLINAYGGTSRSFMDPESSIATYLTFDDPGFQFGGSAEIRDFVIDSFHDEWNQSGENGAYSKGTVDYKTAYGFSSGVLQP